MAKTLNIEPANRKNLRDTGYRTQDPSNLQGCRRTLCDLPIREVSFLLLHAHARHIARGWGRSLLANAAMLSYIRVPTHRKHTLAPKWPGCRFPNLQ